MKIRTDFVTNSSSSSFNVTVKVQTKKGEEISYQLYPMDTDNEDIGPVSENYKTMSLLKKVSSVDELCEILENAAENYFDDEGYQSVAEFIKTITDEEKEDWDGYYSFEDWEKFQNSVIEEKKEFSEKIKKSCSSIDDIEKISIIGGHTNTGEYCELSSINDSELVDLAEKVVNSEGENQKKAIAAFEEYIKKSGEFVLLRDPIEAANDIYNGEVDNWEEYDEIKEIDMTTRKVREYKEYPV